MPEIASQKHLVIHGHFYQPPRENPWTERIDRQSGAAPYHDWNEKIVAECYTPNTCSRRLDWYGRIKKLVNNYEWISFNFGSTLLSWLEAKRPGTYEKILEADKRSAARLGHGNAIVQPYNHIIMPLATARDQETQIRWGIRDFERRFGRVPEGIWLPETAINETTLEILIDFGLRFVVLSPHQTDGARTIRSSGRWKNVHDGSIPTGHPYRCFGRSRSGKRDIKRFIDVFFYDASLSVDVSFNHLLRNGDSFAAAIAASYERDGRDLAVIATDGEIYGHHEPFADMALSYLIDTAASSRGLAMTNFGTYLDTHEPEWEVRLKSGKDGEGTAWSCAHGVGRWKENCGCNVGAPAGWNQKWRSPLRRGLDALRDALAALFEEKSDGLIAAPWEVRDEYISVISERSVENAERFVEEHIPRELTPAERTRALSLLESQRFAQLMFTSCGWFFNDIAGVESVQLLRYAARAIELADESRRKRLEKLLLTELSKAVSNMPGAGTGAEIYTNAVSTAAIDTTFMVGQHAIFAHFFGPENASPAFTHTVRTIDRITRSAGGNSISAGHVEIVSPYVLERHRYQYIVAIEDAATVTCHVKPVQAEGDFRETAERFEKFTDAEIAGDIVRIVRDGFGGRRIDLKDLFIEDRERILMHICRSTVGSVLDRYEQLFDENRQLLRLLRDAEITPPRSLLVPAQTVLTRKLVRELESWQQSIEPSGLAGIKDIVTEAEAHGVTIDTTSASHAFRDVILERIKQFEERLDAGSADALFEFVELSHLLDIEIEMHEIQNGMFRILETTVRDAIDRLRGAESADTVRFKARGGGAETERPGASAGGGAKTERFEARGGGAETERFEARGDGAETEQSGASIGGETSDGIERSETPPVIDAAETPPVIDAAETPPVIDAAETRRAIESFLNLARRFNFNTDSYQERLP